MICMGPRVFNLSSEKNSLAIFPPVVVVNSKGCAWVVAASAQAFSAAMGAPTGAVRDVTATEWAAQAMCEML